MSERHHFRFFVDEQGEAGATVPLSDADLRHLRVLRLDAGQLVEVVDAASELWDGAVDGDRVRLLQHRPGALEPELELVAGALVGGRFDELVDASVQAGASRIVPFAPLRRDAERLAARRARLQRIARAAAKQSKRRTVPDVLEPIDQVALEALEPGIVVDPDAPRTLDAVVAGRQAGQPLRLLVGPADGLDRALVEALVDRGWQAGRLGPSILRAELAAPVALAIAAMHVPRT